jgi:hypothetical protein
MHLGAICELEVDMGQSALRHRAGVGAAAAALAAIVWASAAAAAPDARHCRLAHGWVEDNCGSTAGREGTPARCAKARAWLGVNCPARLAMAEKPADARARGSEVDDDDDDEEAAAPPPRQRKRAHKDRTRVRAYVARPVPADRYRARRHKDRVFVSDYRPLTGNEAAFYAALEKDKY